MRHLTLFFRLSYFFIYEPFSPHFDDDFHHDDLFGGVVGVAQKDAKQHDEKPRHEGGFL